MEFQELVRKRRMHRAFKATAVPKAKLERILETATHAPSAGFTQGWAFIVVRDRNKKKQLAQAAGEEFYTRGGHKPFISGAPVVIIPCGSEKLYIERYREPDKAGPLGKIEFRLPWWLTDPAFASMLIMLTATDEGLATCFTGSFDDKAVRRVLDIPGDYTPLALMPLGYPDRDKRSPSLRRGRRPLSEIVHYDGW